VSFVDACASFVDHLAPSRWLPGRGPLVMMYHGLGGSDGVPAEAFAAQLDLLMARRRVVPLGDALAKLGQPGAEELACITFDDGYVDFAELALPRLRERGLHATLFVPAGLVGGANEWDAGRAAPRRILGAAALRSLDPGFVDIGAHGYGHRRLARLSPDALRAETRDARTRLEDVCGRAVELFAYPYGQRDDFDSAAEAAVAEAGFVAACSTCFGRGSRPQERYRLRRVGVGPGDDPATVRRKIEGAYDWVAGKEAVGAQLRSWRARLDGPVEMS
jgi:peptidoglycan/xylan/chitin deacetylase (PgdA/CDA1 family)